MAETDTIEQYNGIISACKDIFIKKTVDYGTAWRILRIIAVTDQIFIKAQRIRTIQEKKTQLVLDDIPGEFKGIINYAVIGLIQLDIHDEEIEELPVEEVSARYHEKVRLAQDTMLQKNHDYGEAWRSMSQEGLTDLILMKLLRIKQILNNEGKTLISEGIDANFIDILNYAVFALILIEEAKAVPA